MNPENTIQKIASEARLIRLTRRISVLARADDPLLGSGAGGAGTAPTRTLEPETDSKSELARPWNVVVWNDPITMMNYVVYVLQKLFGISRERATQLMLEVHQQGRSIVATVDREKAEYYVSRLHGFGLQASLEQTE